MSALDEAKLMIASVRAALANGIVHMHPTTGEVLTTEESIITVLLEEGSVDFDVTNQFTVTTAEAELAKLADMTPTGRTKTGPNLQPLPIRTAEGEHIRNSFTRGTINYNGTTTGRYWNGDLPPIQAG